jgi:hypothetical protein
MGPAANGSAPDRQGLTGSDRLLQDLVRVEQVAFKSAQRKLQLTKVISLAQLAPIAFQQFRETGVLTFATPMELFDRDFPGHYLRLASHVRVSVIALIPPEVGIRATLTASRTSRVVIGGDIFQTVRVQHGPDLVALSSARDSAGMFDLQMQSEMLFPFEGIGVDTTWELRMPKPANPFDYGSIADVQLAIDYTALNSFDYQQQVLQTLRPSESVQRAWSFRNDLPDQWYDLNNPDPRSSSITTKWETERGDFPINAQSVLSTGVTVYFARRHGAGFELPQVDLRFSEQGQPASVGGQAGSVGGVISTSAGNAAAWMAMAGRSPVGSWELTLPNTETVRSLFQNEDILDMLFVLELDARRPAWPQ